MSSNSDQVAYIGECIMIRSLGTHQYQAFVSKYSNKDGSDAWYNINDSFADEGKWVRHNWEVVAIRNKEDTNRAGYYLDVKNSTIYITVKTLKDIEIQIAKRPE